MPAPMPEPRAKGAVLPSDQAIADIVDMKPEKVVVTLNLPVSGKETRATVTLEWSRADTNMPLTELLKRIETYVAQFGPA